MTANDIGRCRFICGDQCYKNISAIGLPRSALGTQQALDLHQGPTMLRAGADRLH
jgi:hypothetical protein